jgi:hypothetical protein
VGLSDPQSADNCVIPEPKDPECTTKIAKFLVRYTGPTILGATVQIVGASGATSSYNNVDLISGETVLAGQNDWTIDSSASNETDLGPKTSLFINGVEEKVHTSCSVPFVAGAPAPLDNPSGDPSPNWFVISFEEKSGNFVSIGANVQYTYDVTNLGGQEVTDVVVTDSFGQAPGSPIASIAAGDTETLMRTVFIFEATVNEVTASANQGECEDSDIVVVGDPEPCVDIFPIDFDDLPAGTVVEEQFAALGVHISTINTGGGPDKAIVFASANPTGGDDDLGTPNEDFGGPGIGAGGEAGQLGQNDVALGNLLIVAEDDVDKNNDGLIDDPDDEAGGGLITFDFDFPTDVISVHLVDIEESSQGFVIAYDENDHVIVNVLMQMLGDNSVQRVDINAVGARKLEVVFPGSGAVSGVEICLPVSIDIRKQVEGPDFRVVAGVDVEFEIAVTNAGEKPLNNVTVSDPLAPDCDMFIGDLDPGEMATYTCTVAAASIPGGGAMTYKDTFSAQGYGNNDGDSDWSGPWIENDVADGTQSPSAGNVIIGSNHKLWLDDNPNTGTDPSARRTADLSGKTTATWSFDFQTHPGVDPSDAVVAEVSSDGTSFTILETFTNITGSVTGSRSYDISAFISAQTTIRYRVSNLYGGSNETFKVDDVMIVSDGPGALENEACVEGQGAGVTVGDCDTSTVALGEPVPTATPIPDVTPTPPPGGQGWALLEPTGAPGLRQSRRKTGLRPGRLETRDPRSVATASPTPTRLETPSPTATSTLVAAEDSCSGRCGGPAGSGDCECDALCVEHGDCCGDYRDQCETP